MTREPRRIVEAGYDAIAERYAAWRVEGLPTGRWVARLLELLPARGDVLELGCGNGEPAARLLAGRHAYTGVDISEAQLERARAAVPDGRFVRDDFTQLEVEPESVDAVVAILTLTHVPREQHAELLGRIAGWLRFGGLLLATLGVGDTPGAVEDDWLGAPMFFSHFDAETNRRLVRESGFEPVDERIESMVEEGHGETRFLWVLARRVA